MIFKRYIAHRITCVVFIYHCFCVFAGKNKISEFSALLALCIFVLLFSYGLQALLGCALYAQRARPYRAAMFRTLARASLRATLVRQRALSSLNLSATCSKEELSSKTAIVDDSDQIQLSYRALNEISAVLAAQLVVYANGGGPGGTVAAFNKSSTGFVVSMLAAWKLGKVFVPLCIDHSESELSYVLKDSNVSVVCYSSTSGVNEAFLNKCPVPIMETERLIKSHALLAAGKNGIVLGEGSKSYLSDPAVGAGGEDGAICIYTSGTTGRPKGVLHTHSSLLHMTKALVQAWQYSERDKILHFLPLYHVHGLVNKLLCVLSVGGTVDFLPSASAPALWSRLAEEERLYQLAQATAGQPLDPLTLFMAVPTGTTCVNTPYPIHSSGITFIPVNTYPSPITHPQCTRGYWSTPRWCGRQRRGRH
jgi:non-ribosomal peptide synthetase component F